MVNRKACQNPKHVDREVDVLQQHKTTSGSTPVKPNRSLRQQWAMKLDKIKTSLHG